MSCAATDAASTDPGAPTLGLGIRGLTAAEAQQIGVSGRTAVMVTTVVAQGRAQASGLRAGDVILAANGQDVADAADLEERVLDLPRELPLVLRVWRDGRSVDLVVTRTP
jgi:S1-C subfamily serine protease